MLEFREKPISRSQLEDIDRPQSRKRKRKQVETLGATNFPFSKENSDQREISKLVEYLVDTIEIQRDEFAGNSLLPNFLETLKRIIFIFRIYNKVRFICIFCFVFFLLLFPFNLRTFFPFSFIILPFSFPTIYAYSFYFLLSLRFCYIILLFLLFYPYNLFFLFSFLLFSFVFVLLLSYFSFLLYFLYTTLRENEIVLATINLTTLKFKYLELIFQSNKNESSIEYYKYIVTATKYVNY